jgi:hypothetical protein
VKVGKPKPLVMARLSRATRLGFVERHAHGQYRLAPVRGAGSANIAVPRPELDENGAYISRSDSSLSVPPTEQSSVSDEAGEKIG